MKNKTKTIKEINSEFVEWADKYVDMKKKHWCNTSKSVTFKDKFGEVLHGGYGYKM